jgi:hypothetical protein
MHERSTRRPIRWLEESRRDFFYAARTLRRAPAFTTAAVLTLALGIGAVTVIYSVVHNVVIAPLPYRDADRLVNVFVEDSQTSRVRGVFSGTGAARVSRPREVLADESFVDHSAPRGFARPDVVEGRRIRFHAPGHLRSRRRGRRCEESGDPGATRAAGLSTLVRR